MTRGETRLALVLSAGHAAVCAAGLVVPAAYGLAVAADADDRRRLRLLAAVDLPFAATVTDAIVRGAPAGRRLRIGAASDVGRAVVLAVAVRGRAPRSRAALIAASLAGATTAFALSAR